MAHAHVGMGVGVGTEGAASLNVERRLRKRSPSLHISLKLFHLLVFGLVAFFGNGGVLGALTAGSSSASASAVVASASGVAAASSAVAGETKAGHLRLDPHLGVTGEHHDVVDLRHEGGDAATSTNKADAEKQQTDPFDLSDVNRLSDGFLSSFFMILVSELGDETFIIAAIMAMRNPRYVIYSAAMGALILMTILSTALGFVVPNLVNAQLVHHFATFLYTCFGIRLLYIAYRSSTGKDEGGGIQEEIEEVEEKLSDHSEGLPRTKSNKREAWRVLLSQFCTPIFLECFVLTFLAEWGDRSQIATITLAAHKSPVGVTLGAILGHAICTGLAVVGGRLVALRISQSTVAAVGGALFLVFAVHNFFFS